MNQMAIAALKTQYKNFVQSMFDEGVLDNQFSQLQDLQDSSNPNFVDEVITLFCNDAERIITEMNRYLNYQNVDFSKLDSHVHQLKGSSSSIGAHRLKLACVNLRQASYDRSKEECVGAFNSIRHEYCLLRSKFQFLMQIERRIVALETSQQ
ncbi:putative calmodulin binding protein [Hibiscus syriacus]|uniref:Histidine-containing phosphotransfer protein n=1 Tax=Hibiscus syriacus TaxID=106335 RepID=A0A6A2WWT8_HIBSY|nr:histidine-containing phosphotransfer protein 1-like [Hibiscus syriacus]KAE8666293.1 putative calmodulin binding protein [Hibiscus syriacus]